MSDPLVSVLMITYNNVQFLKQAVDSVVSQTYKNWELVINDDCSTDGAWELAQALARKDKRIRAYQNAANVGIQKNRREAFLKTKGDWICHLDGDDSLFKYSIENMVEHMKANPSAMLAQSDSCWVDPQNKIIQYLANSYPDKNLAGFGWRHFGMFKREAYNATQGYNVELTNACEDGDLFMQIAEKFPFIRVPMVLYKHRWHGGNMSHKNEKCGDCQSRPICNYIRVWAKHANMDHITMTLLETKNEN
jgi:glycosyltransferase involved in cell wall biosynthesis